MKRCAKCGVEKESNDFYKNSSRKDGLCSECKKCKIKMTSVYQKSEKGRKVNSKAHSKYIKTLKGSKAQSNYKKSVKGRKVSSKAYSKYIKTGRGKIADARRSAKRRRCLGFVPLNNPFPNSNGHHLTDTYVLYIPVSLHRRFPHNHKKLETMELINDAAVKWYYSLT